MKDLTVFVLTHNRQELLLETIQSILHQTCHDFKFIVSDNSDNNETYELLRQHNMLDRFDYRKRGKLYSSLEHFNLCLSEVDTKYFILFHDDDIMLPNMVDVLYNAINGSEYAAVGCNAYYFINSRVTNRQTLKTNKDMVLSSPSVLVKQYCNRSIIPFPAYIYNKNKIGDVIFQKTCGKYGDVHWLIELNDKNKLKWLGKPNMYYRIHLGQDSQTTQFTDMCKLLRLFKKYCSQLLVINRYRCYILYAKWIKEKQSRYNFYRKLTVLSRYSKLLALKFFIRMIFK